MTSLRGTAVTEEGFALIELMVVVLILGLLLMIAVASYIPATRSAAAAACRQNQSVMVKALSIALCTPDVPEPLVLDDLSSYAANFDTASVCPEDDTPLVLDVANSDVVCPNHP